MRKLVTMILIATTITFSGCKNNDGAIEETKQFMNDFTVSIKEYKDNPSKENLKDVLDIVKNTDIKFNDNDKKVIENGLNEIQANMSSNSKDIIEFWDKNKETVMETLKENTKGIVDKVNQWLNGN